MQSVEVIDDGSDVTQLAVGRFETDPQTDLSKFSAFVSFLRLLCLRGSHSLMASKTLICLIFKILKPPPPACNLCSVQEQDAFVGRQETYGERVLKDCSL